MGPENPTDNPTDQASGSINSKLIDELHKASAARRENQQMVIGEIKENNPEKELFDVLRFAEIYSLKGMTGSDVISPEVVAELEREYYILNPDIQTMQAFAKHRIELDRQGGE